MERPKHMFSSSDGIFLNFMTDEEYHKFNHEFLILRLKHYKKIRDKYGIYANNQGKFVKTIDELNQLDSRRMEKLLKIYKNEI